MLKAAGLKADREILYLVGIETQIVDQNAKGLTYLEVNRLDDIYIRELEIAGYTVKHVKGGEGPKGKWYPTKWQITWP